MTSVYELEEHMLMNTPKTMNSFVMNLSVVVVVVVVYMQLDVTVK